MAPEKITNEMLYELLKEFKADTNRRFEQVDQRLSRLEYDVQAIYRTRDRVSVSFTKAWAGASLFIGFFAAFLAIISTKVVIS